MKAIGARVELALAPLTLLVGPNGVGKSTFLEALGLMAQSARAPMRVGLVEGGPHARLVQVGGGVENLHHGGSPDAPLRLETSWSPPGNLPPIQCWLEVAGDSANEAGRWKQGLSKGTSSIDFEIAAETGRTVATLSGSPRRRADVSGSIARFLDVGLFDAGAATKPQGKPDEFADFARALAGWKILADDFAMLFASPSLRYISALRGAGLMSEEAKGTALSAGRHGEHTIRLLSALQLRGQRDRKQWLRALAERFGMRELEAGYAGDQSIEARYEDAWTEVRLPIASAGFGSQQALPILADITSLPPGGTLLVEEIEHSSHPEWIAAWGQTLAEAAGMGVQIIATTHAPDLVLAAARAVKKGVLAANDLAVHEITRDKDAVRAKRWPVDARGRFAQGWIDSFASAERKLLGDILADDDAEPEKKKRARR